MQNIFKRNILEPLPDNATIVEKGGKRFVRDEARRPVLREITQTRTGDKVIVGQSSKWYGKVKTGPMVWKTVLLYTDKTASERRLKDLQEDADRIDSGVTRPDFDVLRLPIGQLRDRYFESMKQQRRRQGHIDITTSMLDKLIQLGGWKRFRDITRESIEGILKKLEENGLTVSYRNGFIKKAKAFVHHWLPDGMPDPLRKLKRIAEKGAKRNRGRRAATAVQFVSLLNCGEIPEHRRLAYALGVLNGMRRNEIQSLTWGRLHLQATIPFVDILQKNGQDDSLDSIPLHPYVVKLLNARTEAMPDVKLVPTVPDVSTLQRDWKKVGVEMVDDRKLRLDFHALRHTFQTELDRTGCSRATKKKLMRHAAADVTDGYAHAELAEMLVSICRIVSPDSPPRSEMQVVGMTGTSDAAHQIAHQILGANRGRLGVIDDAATVAHDAAPVASMPFAAHGDRAEDAHRVSSGATGGDGEYKTLSDNNLRPDTQVD